MFSSLKTLFRNNGDLYIILSKMKFEYFHKENRDFNIELFNLWKEHLNSDHVLKVHDDFLFCQKIEDAEIITEQNQLQ